jgi:GT2 family glycosyltransferase
VVDWNRPQETVEALTSLAGSEPKLDALICVENGCSSGNTSVVREGAPADAQLLEIPTNIGFTAAVNRGMQVAVDGGADWILLLNNDATVSRQCLSRCVQDAVRNPKTAVVGPAIVFTDRPDRIWYGGGEVNSWLAYTRHRGLMASSSRPPPTSDTGFVTGCCMVFDARAWREVGPFRADYFAYYEDVEWCLRARSRGWRCRYVGEILCQHAVGVSSAPRGSLGLSETSAYFLARNPLRFALETKSWLRRLSRVFGVMTVWNAYNIWRLIEARDAKVTFAYAQGVSDAFRGRMGARRH